MSFGNPLVAGDELIRDRIRSSNYQSGLLGWAINQDGSAEFNGTSVAGNFQGPVSSDQISATGTFTYQGTELSDLLNAFPKGMVAGESSAVLGGQDWGTGGLVGPIAICSINADPARHYVFQVNGLRHFMSTGTNGRTLLGQMRFTRDGTNPTVNSPLLVGSEFYESYGKQGGWSGTHDFVGHAWNESGVFSVGLFIGIGEGDTTSMNSVTSSNTPFVFWCEDIGLHNSGGVAFYTPNVTPPPPITNYDTTWTFTSVQSYQENLNPSIATGANTLAYQGDGTAVGNPGGNHVGYFFFNSAAIRAALAGATITNSYIYLDNQWSYSTSGVTADIGTHNFDPTPATRGAYTQHRWVWNYNPRGADGWTSDLGPLLGQQLRDGTVRGVALGGTDADSINFYAKFQSCKIRVKYQK